MRKELNTFVLESVELWNADGVRENCRLKIENGILVDVSDANSKATHAVLPAGVDTQVHLRVPGQSHKETPKSGTLSALRGGYGAILTMPNTIPVIDSPKVLTEARSLLAPFEKEFGVEVLFSAAITEGENGKRLSDFSSLAAAGIAAFTDDGKGVDVDDLMGQAFEQVAPLELPLLQHSEFWPHKGQLAKGPVQQKLNIPEYLPEQETKMLERDLRLLADYPKARYHLLHMTTKGSLPLLAQAREKGLRVTAEVTPHHLRYSSSDIREDNTSFKMNPPLHSEADRRALNEALVDGRINWVATDHAPHEASAKGTDFMKSAYGTVGMETSLRTLLSLLAENVLSRERLVEVWSTAPAKFLGAQDRFGQLKVGRPFNAVMVEGLDEITEIKESDLYSLSKNSCFIGDALNGRISAHFNRSGAFYF